MRERVSKSKQTHEDFANWQRSGKKQSPTSPQSSKRSVYHHLNLVAAVGLESTVKRNFNHMQGQR